MLDCYNIGNVVFMVNFGMGFVGYFVFSGSFYIISDWSYFVVEVKGF